MLILYIYNCIDTEGHCREKWDFSTENINSFNSGNIKMEKLV